MQPSGKAISNLQRLHQEQAKVLAGIDARLASLRRFADDYKAIDGFMEELPKRLSYRDVIIPFGGTKGLVRGQLVSTNEVLVFLGADHFATMTCHQARELISRRSKSIELQIDASSEERRLFAERMNFTSAFTREQVEGAGGGVVDIKEEVDEEEERRWMRRHRHFLQQKRREEQPGGDEELWRRLEQLEMEEAEEEDDDDEKVIEVVEAKKDDVHGILASPRRKSTDRGERHVRFSVTDSQDDDDDDDCEDRPTVIRFRHSPTTEPASASDSITPASIVRRQGSGDLAPALAATVVERQTEVTTDAVSETSSRRPVSRFRAQRLGKSA